MGNSLERRNSKLEFDQTLPKDRESHPPTAEGLPEGEMGRLMWLLEYELRCAARYRRFAALVLFKSLGEHNASFVELLQTCIRGSDQFFALNGVGAILMGETDTAGAANAVNRYRNCAGKHSDALFGIAGFPSDSTSAAELLRIARRRLQEALKPDAWGELARE
ncbi:MAG: hypothetical protein NTW86_31140 [Candidatus Sumerlaeota bacterium]|nr:hypothetical protein [Candidatus Sumerlaeota bacterium]